MAVDFYKIYDKVVNYIKFKSKKNVSVLHSSEDIFQEGQILLYKICEMYKDKTEQEVVAIFKTSFDKKIIDFYRKKEIEVVDLEDSYNIGLEDDVVEKLYQTYKIEHIKEMLKESPIAYTIFMEYLEPSAEVIADALEDFQKKMSVVESGKRKRKPTLKITSRNIIKVHHLTRREYDNGLAQIRTAFLNAS